jgi:hypothetical protein
MTYDPPRRKTPKPTRDPLEIELVFNVRPCGTCGFFWPPASARQPYGPYSSYDFDSNTPTTNVPHGDPSSYAWLKGTTRAPSFPDAEVMDGCRKAPIMTIGINPNLTAFAPGQTGASWCYPSFSSDNGTDSWTKYAYYYRYRSVYQERFDLRFAERFLLPEGRVTAAKAGVVVSAQRASDAPSYAVKVRYDGEAQDTSIDLRGEVGAPPCVLLFDPVPPHNRFKQGDVIAARIRVPAGEKAEVYAQQIGYYERMVPILAAFEKSLRDKGHAGANLRVGEDVCQLDMVACASPHWGPPWLGGSNDSVQTIVTNCVTKNAWALKQLVQTRPAVLFLVGESTYTMFRHAVGRLIKADPALPGRPEDGAFSLLRATTDPRHPCLFEFSGKVDGRSYRISTRLVVTPHFSYATNFLPQYRMRASTWEDFKAKFADCAAFLLHDPRAKFVPPAQQGDFAAIQIIKDSRAVVAHIDKTWPDAGRALAPTYYDANAMMAGVLDDLYAKGALSFSPPTRGHPGFLARSDGPCSFCVNSHWTFPLGCPYGKPDETPLPVGLLDKVAETIVKEGGERLAPPTASRMLDNRYEARGASPTPER